jgi:F-type H+-transporting ATPase subunit epsilon
MDTFELAVITPSGTVLRETVASAEIPTINGEIGVLPRHCDYVGILGTGTLKYSTASGGKHSIEVSDGSLQFVSNTLTILADTARKIG